MFISHKKMAKSRKKLKFWKKYKFHKKFKYWKKYKFHKNFKFWKKFKYQNFVGLRKTWKLIKITQSPKT